jgi:hypothetical protein
MSATQFVLSPEQEQLAVETVTSLNMGDGSLGPQAVEEALGLTFEGAAAVLRDLCDQRILCQIATPSNNMAATQQTAASVQTKWVRDRVVTTLEVMGAVTALDYLPNPLGTTVCREISKLRDCSMETAEAFLKDLRDRNILEARQAASGRLTEDMDVPPSRWKWFRVAEDAL